MGFLILILTFDFDFPKGADTPLNAHIPTIERITMTSDKHSVSLDDARRILAAGEAKARAIGQPMNLAVVDAGGNLVAHIRMDGAWIGSIDISINKAFTARAFNLSTKSLAEDAQPGGQFYGIHASNGGRIMIFAGGIPLQCDEQIVGAIGVSGGSGEQDQAVAEAAVAAF
ncbi:GlcG/HbpS family heme-binding protein [Nostoc sp.]|uniref:GlcG/HbpS family heme-binding protein n=1 Tax=Nostoc sp. TaxID=1180 RepID=UPI002FFB93A8